MVESVHIFIDNLNLWIRGKYSVGSMENLGKWKCEREYRELEEMRIDYGSLVETLRGGRSYGSVPFIVGSRPPVQDSLWETWRRQGMEVEVLDRNCQNKEKGIDTTLTVEAMEILCSKSEGTLVLLAGDGDYKPLLRKATDRGWQVEVFFWQQGEFRYRDDSYLSNFLDSNEIDKNLSRAGVASWIRTSPALRFVALETMYKTFTFATGRHRDGEHKFVVRIGTSEDLVSWRNSDVLDFFRAADVFVWCKWIDSDALELYFRTKIDAEKALQFINHTKPEWSSSVDALSTLHS